METFQKLLRRIFLGGWDSRLSRPPQLTSLNTSEQWQAYWEAQGQPWRREPEIDLQRQAELVQKRAIAANSQLDIYPFKGVKLTRADVEWLLATHEDGRGPVDWSEEAQRAREGLDLRGADLRGIDLSDLPLARLQGGIAWSEELVTVAQYEAASIHLENAFLRDAHLEGAFLRSAFLGETIFERAHLEEAVLDWVRAEHTIFYQGYLEKASLQRAYLKHADLGESYLTGADLRWANLEEAALSEAHLEGVRLEHAFLDRATRLENIVLGNETQGYISLADVQWGEANLSVVKWSQMEALGDEQRAQEPKKQNGEVKDFSTRLRQHETATRANRQLALALQAQGLNEEASRFAYRAQVLQRHASWFEMLQQGVKLRQRGRALGAWLFSWFLFLLAGYGYKPGRSFLAYLLVIVAFTLLYLRLDGHLAWYEAVVVSMTAFHGRGFSPSTFSPGDPLSIASAFEAFVGLIIEVTFIATLTQRFFNK